MITIRARNGAIGVCLLLLIGGCSREQQDWRSAEAADTIESYEQFIQRHPDSELTTQARSRVAQLGEERDWERAASADNVDAYRQFLEDHPNGKWAQEARIRIENFSLGQQASVDALKQAGNAAPPAPAAGGEARTAAAAPAASSAATPKPVPAAGGSGTAPSGRAKSGSDGGGSFGIQLGAFGSEAAANNQWQKLTARFGPELAGLEEHVVAADTPSGRIYRLQATVGDQGRARTLCESLRKRSQACLVVLPH